MEAVGRAEAVGGGGGGKGRRQKRPVIARQKLLSTWPLAPTLCTSLKGDTFYFIFAPGVTLPRYATVQSPYSLIRLLNFRRTHNSNNNTFYDFALSHIFYSEADPTCATNIGYSELIGPNSCRLQETVVQLNCSIGYKGNVPPQWHVANVKGGIVSPVPQSSCFAGDGRVTCNYAEYSEIGMHGSYFVCHTNRSGITRYNCKTEVVKIHCKLIVSIVYRTAKYCKL